MRRRPLRPRRANRSTTSPAAATVITPKAAGHTNAPSPDIRTRSGRRSAKYHASKIVTVSVPSAHRYGWGRYGSPMNNVGYPGRIMISTCHNPTAAKGAPMIGSSAAAAPAAAVVSLLALGGEPAPPPL
jgi:hypothetical protein